MRSLLLIASTTLLILTATSSIFATDNRDMMQVRVFYTNQDQLLDLQLMHLDIIIYQSDHIEAIVNQNDLDKITLHGFDTKVIHEDVVEFYQSRLPDKDMGGYKTLEEINSEIDLITDFNPTLVSSKISIGQTVEGRDIWAFKISDNPDIDEDEPEILFTAGIHAREVITPEVLFGFINHLLGNYAGDPEIQNLVDNREIWFIPLINPDGYYYNQTTEPDGGGMWRKNRKDNGDGTFGVDLNRNFGYMWGYDDYGSSPNSDDETYRGTGPFSEPETQALRDFTTAHDFVFTIYYHSAANLILWPYGFSKEPSEDEYLFEVMADSFAVYSDYDAYQGSDLYLTNGTNKDWDYGERTTKNKILPFIVEVGSSSDGFWPPVSRISPLVVENIELNLYLVRQAGDITPLYPLMRPNIPVIDAPDTTENEYTVVWTHEDEHNPAVSYELTEIREIDSNITETCDDFYNWDYDLWEITSSRYISPPNCLWSGPTWDTIGQPDRVITAKAPYLVQPGDTLRFKTMYYTDLNIDYLFVLVSTIDDTTRYSLPGNLTTNENPYGTNWRGNGLTGYSGYEFVDAWYSLDDWVGERIIIQFYYLVVSFSPPWGFYIDDISPIPVAGLKTEFTDITETSIDFTDKPSTLYHYKVRAKDAQGQYSDYSGEVFTFVLQQSMCGDANGDNEVNVGDVVYLISFVFKFGPPPAPACLGDANGDGQTNIGDAVWLIGYIFKGGPPPVSNCCP